MTLSIMTFSIMKFSIMTFSIMTFSIMTFSIMTYSITAFSIMTYSITAFRITTFSTIKNRSLSILTLDAECCYVEWLLCQASRFLIMFNVVMQNVVLLNVLAPVYQYFSSTPEQIFRDSILKNFFGIIWQQIWQKTQSKL